MQPVDKTSTQHVTTQTEAPDRGQGKEGASADFEKVMDRKGSGTSSKESTAATKGKDTSQPEKLDTARGTEHGIHRRHDREGERGGAHSESKEQGGDESRQYRPLPGDMAIPFDMYGRMQQLDLGAAGSISPAEAIAQIQRIVDKIVEAVQVQMKPGGLTDVHIELNMGKLGNMTVDLQRTAEGQIRINFQAATAEASDLLQNNLSDLTSRLETRGVNLSEVSVRSVDRAEFRWEPPVAKVDQATQIPPEPVTRSQAASEAQWDRRAHQDVMPRADGTPIVTPGGVVSQMQPDNVVRTQASSESQLNQQGSGQDQEERKKRDRDDEDSEQ